MLAETDEMTFESTHPWLTFEVDLTRAPATLWLDLGEARSKCEHIAGVPLAPELASKFLRVYLAKGALATTAIEGNTLSEEEVQQFLDGKLKLPPSREYLGKEIENIITACNALAQSVAKTGEFDCSVDAIKWMNKTVLEGLTVEPEVIPGQIRNHSVNVGRYRGAPANECEYLLVKLCEWLKGRTFRPTNPNEKIIYAIIQAVLAHLYIAWIHPFGDGNGRTARLLEFSILLASGMPQPTAHLLSNHYNKTKTEYYRQLDAASRSGGNVIPFIEYAVQGFVDGLREQVDTIKAYQIDVAWVNYVHDRFSGKNSAADDRRRCLVLDLAKQSEPVPYAKLGELSPRLAKAYAGKTPRTTIRDVNALVKMGLVQRTPRGIRADKEVVLAFLPWRNRERKDQQTKGR